MGTVAITSSHWIGFISCVLLFLALDLGWFHRRAREVKIPEAAAWSVFWFLLAMAFAAALAYWRTREEAIQFTTGYLIELSLSLDNLLVITLIFAWFQVPVKFQHRLLFWGILGALVMRGAMIGAGAELINQFDWVLYLFGAFLVFAGVRMLRSGEDTLNPERNLVLRLARKYFTVSPELDGQKLFTRIDRGFALTPLALALLLIETTDLLFAVDSIPAVFSITRNAFIVFTSNIMAILCLRSMYFLLVGALGSFRYLKVGLSVVLAFIGVKMLLDPHDRPPQWFQVQIPTSVSLMMVAAILAISVALSLTADQRDKKKSF
ncbi:MAG: TerC/Alx family metal homeostasis membrane protein [Verrucomicrobiota bacterium]|jgi:tellurite resistance protein TerC